MAISGVMDTMATIPNASLTIFPPIAWHTPMANGRRKVAVIGPDATPPESNAIAVNIFGTKKDRQMAITYPGRINQKTEIPVSTRTIARPTDTATPRERLNPMDLPEIAPEVIHLFHQYIDGGLCFYDKEAYEHTDRYQNKTVGQSRDHLSQIVSDRHETYVYSGEE